MRPDVAGQRQTDALGTMLLTSGQRHMLAITSLLGSVGLWWLMSAAGWDFYMKEWWHYQLFNARSYPLYSDRALPHRMMDDD